MREQLKIAVLGSTGSIGCSTLAVLRDYRDRCRVIGLSASSRVVELGEQIREFSPEIAVISGPGEARAQELVRGAGEGAGMGARVGATVDTGMGASVGTCIRTGPRALEELAAHPEVDVVVAALVGVDGLRPVEAAVRAGKTVLIANKESLVCAGELLTGLARRCGARLVPVDSEHSSVAQLLMALGERRDRRPAGDSSRAGGELRRADAGFSDHADLARITLTASGGPFLRRSLDELSNVTPQEAAAHPRWKMGAKISIDSSTLVNKAYEVAEAVWLFGLPEERVDVLVHPQSIVHALVELVDGVQLAHLSVPDMRGPIAYALFGENFRVPGLLAGLKLGAVGRLDFEPLDDRRFPTVRWMREALRAGGAMPAVYAFANDAAVAKFQAGGLSFVGIGGAIEEALAKFAGRRYGSLQELAAIKAEVEAGV